MFACDSDSDCQDDEYFDESAPQFFIKEHNYTSRRSTKRRVDEDDEQEIWSSSRSLKLKFPNFVDPVPPNHTFTFPTKSKLPPANQCDEVSSTNQVLVDENSLEHEVDKDVDAEEMLLFNRVFDGLCLLLVLKQHGCDKMECLDSHVIPNIAQLEQTLSRLGAVDLHDFYKLVLFKFTSKQRDNFLPVFSKIFVAQQNMNALKQMVADCQDTSPFTGFGFIVDSLLRKSWSCYDAVKFIIDNQVEKKATERTRREIIKLIGSTGKEVVKFLAYLNTQK